MSQFRTTHTFALMEVSESTFNEIYQKLVDADYWHCIDKDENATQLNMIGIALIKEKPSESNTD